MHWFQRPPYLRWAAGALIVLAALYLELRPSTMVDHPFAATDIAAGDAVGGDSVGWRRIPAGILAVPDLGGGVAARAVAAGSPLLPGDLASGPLIPAGWWSVPMAIPHAPPGTPVRLVLTASGTTVDGVVVATPDDDGFGLEPQGLVAVPGEAAGLVAVATANRDVIVLVAPGEVG